jgi:hypothetical protein
MTKQPGGSHRPWTRLIALAALPLFLSSCAFIDVVKLAGDATMGRDNGTPGSAMARQYIIDQLKPIARGADTTLTGDAAYTQAIPGGTNVLAVIPGTDRADQYVMVGAHYDHLGSNCRTSNPNDTICNGATDNAAGDAAVLAIARSIAHQATPPRRSIILAFWDEEEDGLLGSLYYTQHPIVPLAKTVAYVNFDIQGSDLRPSLDNTTFAVGAESGGSALQSTVQSAINASTLDAVQLSAIFGENRSDYVNLLHVNVPTVFFSDATGPCYHTAQDQIDIVDFAKLNQQIAIALHVTRDLSDMSTPPAFVSSTALATYDDALALARVTERLWNDRDLFSTADRAVIANGRTDITGIVARGRAAFGSGDVSTILGDAAAVVTVLTHGVCDGFLPPSK